MPRPRKDQYYRQAKKQGYRARSAFKLKQMIRKYKLLEGVNVVVELCSSPGGWTQVLREKDRTMEIVAVDINPMAPLPGVKFVKGDITEDTTLEKIEQLTRGSADLILSDCSPNVSGHWDIDVARQLDLARITLEIGHKLLEKNGKVLTKVFEGRGFREFMTATRKSYNSVKLVKPDASRKTSAEIYLLAIGPKKN
ncbi:RlmE family RNA methyltransferase [Candidatus Thorarchaeota archaeon]|nr:MAG: RlmE family RNA methyltransferase [Candidatus Thorarchaeota archaeon]